MHGKRSENEVVREALKAWRRKHNYLCGRKNQLEKLLKVWGRRLKGQSRDRRLGAWEAELASVSAQIIGHGRLGEQAGFSLVDADSSAARGVDGKGDKSGKAHAQKPARAARAVVGPSKLSTEEIQQRIRKIDKQLGSISTKGPKKATTLLADKHRLVEELNRRISGTNRESTWQRWSKAPDKVRFRTGRSDP